jgi:hypothetical protein
MKGARPPDQSREAETRVERCGLIVVGDAENRVRFDRRGCRRRRQRGAAARPSALVMTPKYFRDVEVSPKIFSKYYKYRVHMFDLVSGAIPI